jgi:hypothetical protein
VNHLLNSGNLFRKLSERSMDVVFNGEPLAQQLGVGLQVVAKTVCHLLNNREHAVEHFVFPHCQAPNQGKENSVFHSEAEYSSVWRWSL